MKIIKKNPSVEIRCNCGKILTEPNMVSEFEEQAYWCFNCGRVAVVNKAKIVKELVPEIIEYLHRILS